MISRRNLIIGAGCISAVAAGNALRPHRSVTLLGSGKLAPLVPAQFGAWTSQETGDPLALNGPGTLSAQLYNELVGRSYFNSRTGTRVEMLLAYGRRQSDDLQLHRPEVCYPAFGYAITTNQPTTIPLAPKVPLPARRLVAESNDAADNIIYWTRFGERLPQDGSQQRAARFEIALQGIIPDGVLCRFSTSGDYPSLRWREISDFVGELVMAIPSSNRKILVGTTIGNELARLPA